MLGDELLSGPDNAVTAEQNKHTVVTRSKDNRIFGGTLTAANAVANTGERFDSDLLTLCHATARAPSGISNGIPSKQSCSPPPGE